MSKKVKIILVIVFLVVGIGISGQLIIDFITDITILEHQNGQGDDAVQIISDIIDAQHLNVDLISGASYSSKVILLAVFDALNP